MTAAVSLRVRAALAGESPLVQQVALVIADVIPASGVHVSAHRLAEFCFERGVVSPTHGSRGRVSYGTVDLALRLLRAAGVLSWATAYVRRWHADCLPLPGQPRTVRHADGTYSLPARFLALVAASIERFHSEGAAVRTAAAPLSEREHLVSIEPAPRAYVAEERATASDWRDACARLGFT